MILPASKYLTGKNTATCCSDAVRCKFSFFLGVLRPQKVESKAVNPESGARSFECVFMHQQWPQQSTSGLLEFAASVGLEHIRETSVHAAGLRIDHRRIAKGFEGGGCSIVQVARAGGGVGPFMGALRCVKCRCVRAPCKGLRNYYTCAMKRST